MRAASSGYSTAAIVARRGADCHVTSGARVSATDAVELAVSCPPPHPVRPRAPRRRDDRHRRDDGPLRRRRAPTSRWSPARSARRARSTCRRWPRSPPPQADQLGGYRHRGAGAGLRGAGRHRPPVPRRRRPVPRLRDDGHRRQRAPARVLGRRPGRGGRGRCSRSSARSARRWWSPTTPTAATATPTTSRPTGSRCGRSSWPRAEGIGPDKVYWTAIPRSVLEAGHGGVRRSAETTRSPA